MTPHVGYTCMASEFFLFFLIKILSGLVVSLPDSVNAFQDTKNMDIDCEFVCLSELDVYIS